MLSRTCINTPTDTVSRVHCTRRGGVGSHFYHGKTGRLVYLRNCVMSLAPNLNEGKMEGQNDLGTSKSIRKGINKQKNKTGVNIYNWIALVPLAAMFSSPCFAVLTFHEAE